MEKNFTLYMSNSTQPVVFDKTEHLKLSKSLSKKTFFNDVNLTKNGETFWLLDGPPYANGNAHMGHALNKVWKDFNVKFNWFLGNKTHWLPGWDCHGLPLELLVEKQQKYNTVLDKKTACKKLALKSVAKQKHDFHDLSVTANWDNPYLTLSPKMKKHTWSTLSTMYEKDLLEYKQWPTHHCPACGSSLAEAELEYTLSDKEHLYFKYPLSKPNHYALVWTTTPWTLPMNQALAFSNELSYNLWENKTTHEFLYVENNCSEKVNTLLVNLGFTLEKECVDEFKKFTGFNPLSKNSTPLLEASFVESGSTGFVHVACAHGPEDFELGQKNNLSPLNLLDKNGRYLDLEQVPVVLKGKKNKDATQDVLDLLKEFNSFFHYETEKTENAVCWRHKTKVYYQSGFQVFLNLEKLKPKVRKMLDNSSLQPSQKEKLSAMLLSRPHWCLSRQRYWGTALNLVVDKKTNTLSNHTPYVLNLFFNNKEDEAHQFLNNHPELELVTDVVDVWFDSGNVLQAVKAEEKLLKNPNLVLEGKDQYRGWFQSLFWLEASVSNTEDMPYEDVLVHGFVLDAHKEKFSKSNKNGLNAKEAVSKYGSDVVRLWTASQEKETDAVFSEAKMKEANSFYQRLRLSLRFLSSNMSNLSKDEHNKLLLNFENNQQFDFHLFVLSKMKQVQNNFQTHMNNFEYKKALQELYLLSDQFLSSFVFETLKPTLYLKNPNTQEKQMAQVLCREVFENLTTMLAVFCPLTAQEFWNTTKLSVDYPSVFNWSMSNSNLSNLNTNKLNWNKALLLRQKVLKDLEKLQAAKVTKTLSQLRVTVLTNDSEYVKFTNSLSFTRWLGVSELSLLDGTDELSFSLYSLNLDETYGKCPRCWYYYPKTSFSNELCDDCFHEH